MKITDDMIDRGLQAYQEPWWSIDAGCGSHSDRLTVRRILILALSDFHMTTPKEEPISMPIAVQIIHRLMELLDGSNWPEMDGERLAGYSDAMEPIEALVSDFQDGAYKEEPADMLEGMGKESTELLRQLDGYAKAQYEEDRILSQVLHDAAAALAAKDKEIARLHERLEDNHEFRVNQNGQMERVEVTPGSIPDGIEARDITIKMQDEALAANDKEIAGLKSILGSIADMNPEIHSTEGYNEWGEADCFRQAQDAARAAIAAKET